MSITEAVEAAKKSPAYTIVGEQHLDREGREVWFAIREVSR